MYHIIAGTLWLNRKSNATNSRAGTLHMIRTPRITGTQSSVGRTLNTVSYSERGCLEATSLNEESTQETWMTSVTRQESAKVMTTYWSLTRTMRSPFLNDRSSCCMAAKSKRARTMVTSDDKQKRNRCLAKQSGITEAGSLLAGRMSPTRASCRAHSNFWIGLRLVITQYSPCYKALHVCTTHCVLNVQCTCFRTRNGKRLCALIKLW